jgi:hypothetical protein
MSFRRRNLFWAHAFTISNSSLPNSGSALRVVFDVEDQCFSDETKHIAIYSITNGDQNNTNLLCNRHFAKAPILFLNRSNLSAAYCRKAGQLTVPVLCPSGIKVLERLLDVASELEIGNAVVNSHQPVKIGGLCGCSVATLIDLRESLTVCRFLWYLCCILVARNVILKISW